MTPADDPQHRGVIDMWAPVVPAPEIIGHMQANFPAEQLQYLEVFTKQRLSEEQFGAYAATLVRDDQQILAELDRADIRHSLITGFDERSSCGKTFVSNDAIAAVSERHPERFIPFAGADVMRGSEAVRELEYWITQRRFRGLSLRPFMIGRPASDQAYFPFYALCAHLGVPVSIHTSANWTRTQPSELGHPRHIDEVACHFPELTLIMSHAGYPWVLEACLIAWKHPNVYLELAAHRPRYFTASGAGWEPLMRFGQSTIVDKILYGTGAFLLARTYAELVEEIRALPIAADISDRWLWRNAATLLRFEPPELGRNS
jgi:uncharacterized protein